MRIIIAGAGEVGTHLASANYDMLTRVGNPTSIRDQREIGVKDCDLFISVTPHETENMTACLIANSLGAKRTLARIDNYEYLLPENRKFFENMGLNHLIYPEVLAANEIEESLRTNWMRYHLHLCQGALELCIVKVRETAKILGQSFASGVYNHGKYRIVAIKRKYRIVAIKRDQQTIIPRGQDTVEVNDLVYCVCPKENMEYMREELGKSKREINNVIFFGGDRIARKAATELVDEMNIKIIEKDRDLCNILSAKVPNALVINADGSDMDILKEDMDILKEEGIQDADAFVAVTDSSEANIFACLAAKRFGVRKTIAEVENLDYIPMAEGLDIGTVLNKKTIAASYIYQMLLDASVRGVHNLTSADAEIVEFYAKEGSTITRHKVKDVRLPDEANIGGIVRAGEGILVNGETQIIAGDLVVVFCKSHVIRTLERYFK